MPTHKNSDSATCVGLHQEKQCSMGGSWGTLSFSDGGDGGRGPLGLQSPERECNLP